ncbi:MAG: type II toxin-antitoxin system VapC family toxin [Lachnospiraceae bacterium]|nr:type II toxin-antitoxin system VapC family toxin [Lachnospiraceae bacterium]
MTDSKYFIDTAPYIYYLESNDELAKKMEIFFSEEYKANSSFVTSVITVEEYLVYPYRNNDNECVARFHRFIEDVGTKVVHVDERIADEAARIRAKYQSFKAMDALQLATAKVMQCKGFVTNDKQLKQYTDIKIILVEDLK